MNQKLHLYTSVNYVSVGEPITMGLFVSTEQGYSPADAILNFNSITVNFNDYTASSYVCSFDDHIFTYSYHAPYNPAFIQISATINSTTYTQTFSTIQVVESLAQTDLSVKRASPQNQVDLPYPQVYIPVNSFATATTVNQVLNKLYDNFEFLVDLTKTYEVNPQKTAWGGFVEFEPSACFETVFNSLTDTFSLYGVINNTNNVVKLLSIPEQDYEAGTSLLQVVSTVPDTINTVSISAAYCSNILNRGVELLSSADIDLSSITNTITNTPFTHTVIDYLVKDSSGNPIIPTASDLLIINSCNQNRIIQTFTLSGAILPVNTTYTPKTINWNIKNQFKYSPTITSANIFEQIKDITITSNNTLYLTRDAFIEKYDISSGFKEMEFTTKIIDISETFTNAKSVAITDGDVIHMLDNTRHLVHIYQINSVTGKIESIGEWGSLGGATAKTGFYKPNQMFSHKNKIYICDTTNKVLKQYNAQGNWEFTYFDIIPQDSTDTVISACVDKQDNIHVATENYLISLTPEGNTINKTLLDFESPVIKITTNSDGGMIYVCCTDRVHRFTLTHKLINTFAILTDTETSLSTYTSIAVDTNSNVYLTDGRYLIKYLDISNTIASRSSATDGLFWSRDQIKINKDELVDDWVYNRSLRRIAENIDILYKSLESKIVSLTDDKFTLLPFDETDAGIFQGLPVNLDDFCVIGLNEFVTSEVINRCIDNIQQNIYYVLCVILNCFTSTKSGLQVNFAVAPPVLPDCCWNWYSRETNRCCTPWYWLMDNITWVHAQNKSNGVLLSGGWFAVPAQQATGLNRINPNITFSFWASSLVTDFTNTYNLIGFTNTSASNPGVIIGVSSEEIVANINGTYYPTTGSIMTVVSSTSSHIAFTKQNDRIAFYINNTSNANYSIPEVDISVTTIPENAAEYPSDAFMFGDSSIPIAANGFIGILHDIWVFNDYLTSEQISNLYSKPAYWQLPTDYRRKAVAHWYGNSEYFWVDDVGNYDAIVSNTISSTKLTLNNLLGSCCDV